MSRIFGSGSLESEALTGLRVPVDIPLGPWADVLGKPWEPTYVVPFLISVQIIPEMSCVPFWDIEHWRFLPSGTLLCDGIYPRD